MKTITVRDLRQRWPEAEAALQVEDEIIITRDSKPVARRMRVVPPETKRPRWNPEAHRKWIKKVFGNGGRYRASRFSSRMRLADRRGGAAQRMPLMCYSPSQVFLMDPRRPWQRSELKKMPEIQLTPPPWLCRSDFSEATQDGPGRAADFYPGDAADRERVRQQVVTMGGILLGR